MMGNLLRDCCNISLSLNIIILCIISKSLANVTLLQLDVNDWKSITLIGRRMKILTLKGHYIKFIEVNCKNEEKQECLYSSDSSFSNISEHKLNEWKGIIGRNKTKENKMERKDMTNVFIRVTTIHNPPLTMLKKQENITVLTGYVGDIWNDLQDILKFRYLIHKTIDGAFGNIQKQNCQGGGEYISQQSKNCVEWSGMIGQLIRNEVDLIATPLTMTEKRLSVLHFSSPLLRTSEGFFIRLDPELLPSHVFYLQPFSESLWLTFGTLVLVFLPVVHALLCYFAPYCSDRNEVSEIRRSESLTLKKHICDRDMASVFHWLLESLGIFCQQGLQYVPHSLSVRVTLIITLFTSTMVYNVYSGSLASFLTIEKEAKPPFNSLEDLLRSDPRSSFSIGILGNSSLTEILSSQKRGVYKDAWDRINSSRSGLVSTRLQGYHRACVEKYAFFTLKASYEGYRKELPCELHLVPESNFNSYMGLSVRKGYSYSNVIDETLLKMMEVGVLYRQRLKWWPPRHQEEFIHSAIQKESEIDTSDPVMKISFQQVQFVFGILFVGCVLSLIILVFEKMSNWYRYDIKS